MYFGKIKPQFRHFSLCLQGLRKILSHSFTDDSEKATAQIAASLLSFLERLVGAILWIARPCFRGISKWAADGQSHHDTENRPYTFSIRGFAILYDPGCDLRGTVVNAESASVQSAMLLPCQCKKLF